MEEQEEQVEVRDLQEELSKLRSLKTQTGFFYLMKIAEIQVKERTDQLILSPLATMDAVLGQEYQKGEIAGIKLFVEFTDIRIRDLEEQIETALAGKEQENEPLGNS